MGAETLSRGAVAVGMVWMADFFARAMCRRLQSGAEDVPPLGRGGCVGIQMNR